MLLRRLIAAMLLVGVFVVGLGGFASAFDDTGVRVQVFDQVKQGNSTAKNPLAKVRATVFRCLESKAAGDAKECTKRGAEIGKGTTDDQGRAVVTLPGEGSYTVELDESSLPSGKTLNGGPAARTFSVNPGSTFTVNYFTGSTNRETKSFASRFLQRSLDGTRLGLVIGICSIGLSLIFGTTGLTNFAHGEMVTFGGMIAFLLNVTIGISLWIAGPLTVLAGGLFGYLLDWWLWSRLRKRGVGLVSQLVVSVGLSIALRYLFLYRFQGRTRPLKDFSLQKAWNIGPVTITPRDLSTMIISIVVLVAVGLALQRTRLGKATRAVADNVDLASATGIDAQNVIRLVWVVGGALAALGGVIRGLDQQVGFEMGAGLLFLMFAGITLGGLGSAYGALVGGFVVGLFVELSTLFKVPTELKNAPALAILVLVLLVRPQGILGRKERVG